MHMQKKSAIDDLFDLYYVELGKLIKDE